MNFPAKISKPLANVPETLDRAFGHDVGLVEVVEANETERMQTSLPVTLPPVMAYRKTR